jgi:hypothetical protein
MNQQTLFPQEAPSMISGAVISDCGRYRYQLWRIWDASKPNVLFVMHNPSTADGLKDDPTIRRCIGFARSWGYGGIYVGNLFPYRATDPDELKALPFEEVAGNPFEAFKHTSEMVQKCQLHILAYGNPAIKDFTPAFFDNHWHYLKLTNAGNPCHPLYLIGDLQPKRFNSRTIT